MEQESVYVGLDYHQHSVQVCVLDGAGRQLRNRSVGNSVAEVAGAVNGAGVVAGVAIEACCGAADLAEHLRRDLAWPVQLAHAGYVSRLKGSPDKTDWGDARLLADLCRLRYVPGVWLAPAFIRELRALVDYRQQLVNARRSSKLRILAVLREHRVPLPARLCRWNRAWITWVRSVEGTGEHGRWIIDRQLSSLARLNDDIKAVEVRLHRALADDAVTAKLREQPGIGAVTAWMLRAHIGWFDRFRSGKQLARYCGLSPRNASSGSRQADAGTIHAGDPHLKSVLVEAGHRLARRDERWRALAQKLRGRGKPGSLIAMAIANRWVRWLYHQMKEVPQPAAA